MKPNITNNDMFITRPPNSYPGPMNIYAPEIAPIHIYNKAPSPHGSNSKPNNTYLPPDSTKKPDNTYLPPTVSSTPGNTYLPPNNTYLPPKPDNTYLPPHNDDSSDNKPESIYIESLSLLPPKVPECECNDMTGKLIIPIQMKNREKEDCIAKLILPTKPFDSDMIQKLKDLLPTAIDTDLFLKHILENLL
jgi:hypothetical protein